MQETATYLYISQLQSLNTFYTNLIKVNIEWNVIMLINYTMKMAKYEFNFNLSDNS